MLNYWLCSRVREPSEQSSIHYLNISKVPVCLSVYQPGDMKCWVRTCQYRSWKVLLGLGKKDKDSEDFMLRNESLKSCQRCGQWWHPADINRAAWCQLFHKCTESTLSFCWLHPGSICVRQTDRKDRDRGLGWMATLFSLQQTHISITVIKSQWCLVHSLL